MASAIPASTKPRLGISACLMGSEVRFNGGHKESRLCSQALAQHVEFVALCPEVAIGLGIPRAAIRLVDHPQGPRAVDSRDPSRDHTQALQDYGQRMAAELDGLSGYIFMQKSPSCGLHRVKLYGDNGNPVEGGGRGIFAAAITELLPDLPVEEEGRLNDPVLRENFLTRVFAYAEWQALLRDGLTRSAIIGYHSRYKYLLMATDPVQYKAIGRLLGSLGEHDPQALGPRYFSALMRALRKCATRGTHSNVLQHLSGYLRGSLDSDQRQEIQQLIEQYRQGIVPLVVPMTLLKHHFRQHPHPYIERQAYMQPHPETLSLRNAL